MEAVELAPHPDYVLVPRSAIEAIVGSLDFPAPAPRPYDPTAILDEFAQACRVDYRLDSLTIAERMRHVRRLLQFLDKHPLEATRQELRGFLEINPAQNAVKALRVLYGRFFESDLADCFKVPQSPSRVIIAPTPEQLRQTYDNLWYHIVHTEQIEPLELLELQAAYLLAATSGLRLHEFARLTWDQIDMENRIIYPDRDSSRTKFQWVTCFNFEAKIALERLFLAKSPSPDERVFTLHKDTISKKFKRASSGTGIKITPQVLRDWFCCEMGRLGVPDRYVDAFCGRIPRKVLGRHYTDYSPARLKEIYDKADLKLEWEDGTTWE